MRSTYWFILMCCVAETPSGVGDDGGAPSTSPDAAVVAEDAGVTLVDAGVHAVRALGVVRELASPCQIAGNANGGAPCVALEVSECPNVSTPATVELRITPAVGNERGVVVFGSGGGGVVFYAGSSPSPLNRRLAEAGFTVVERAWRTPWTSNPSGMIAAACRYASVLDWLKRQRANSVPLCASGNSGGAAELGYALGFYGVAAKLKLVVPTGGPVASRWDYYCHGQSNAAWQAVCRNGLPSDFCTGRTVACSSAEAGGAQGGSCNTDAAILLSDSVLSPGALLDYGTTDAHFMQGLNDCEQPNVPIGLLWPQEVKSPHTVQFLPDTPHEVASSLTGQDALVTVITARCPQ